MTPLDLTPHPAFSMTLHEPAIVTAYLGAERRSL